MARNKTKKYEYIANHPRVINTNNFPDLIEKYWIDNIWHKIFWNTNSLVLELACWYWEYTIGLAKKNPDKNFVWYDIKWDRIYNWIKQAELNNLKNVRFVHWDIRHIEFFFQANSVDQIKLIHPDPWEKKSHWKHRLTYDIFMEKYKKILKKNWLIELQTDNLDLFLFSLEKITKYWFTIKKVLIDLYDQDNFEINQWIITRYAKNAIDEWKQIYYVQAVSR